MDLELNSRIGSFLEKFFEGKNLYLVEVGIAGSRIHVFIDGLTTNVTIQECATTSRAIEEYLETNHLVPEKYYLEVSSPGLDKPLKLPRQFIKAIGKEVEVKFADGKKLEGKLLEYMDDSIKIEVKGKSKKEETVITEIKLEEIKSVKHLIKFN